jgi:Tol biopolymer transport system component
LAVAASTLATPAWGQSVSTLLQEGIFTEETVGDLDAAIKIYEKIVAESERNRPFAAQAQYRVGMCYLKQGEKDRAAAAFRKVIDRFPQQADPIARAKVQLAALGHPVSAVGGGARYRLVLDDALTTHLGGRGGRRGGDYDFSPDGERIVFLAPWDLEQVDSTARGQGARNGTAWAGLYVCDRTGTVIKPLVDIERPMSWLGCPRWSPDGRLIAFGASVPPAEGEARDRVPALFIVGSEGGAPRQVGPAPLPGGGGQGIDRRGLCWTPDSRHLTYAHRNGFHTVDLDGKVVRLVERSNDRFLKLGGYSPDGQWLAFSEPNPDGGMDVWVIRSAGGEAVRVTDGTIYAGHPTWAHDGRAIYFVARETQNSPESNVWTVELDPLNGAAVGSIEQVTFYSDARINHPRVVPGGDGLAFILSKRNVVINVADASRPESARALARGVAPTLSPDGQTLYYLDRGPGQAGIFALSLKGGAPRSVASTKLAIARLNLSPDGRTLAYAERTDEKVDFYTVPAQGGEPRLLGSSVSRSGYAPCWSPDGTQLAYAHDDGLYVIQAGAGEPRTRIARLPSLEPWSVRWSPDGEHVAAFGQVESEKGNAIFIVPATGGEPRRLTPPDRINKEGLEWHPDSRRITYHLSMGRSRTNQAFVDGRPPALLLDHADSWDYVGEWAPDGRRFYFAGNADGEWKVFVHDTESGDVQLFRDHGTIPVWSRDGATMAWSIETTTRQLWVTESFRPEPEVTKAPVPSTRQVWAPARDTMGAVSPDGRYFSHVNWNTGNLAVHDNQTGENRDLTDEGTWETPNRFSDVSIWSPDGRRIAYCWIDQGDGASLRIVGLDGGEPRVVHIDPESGYAWPRAWSHDGRHIAAVFCNKGVADAEGHIDKIVVVSVADGSMRTLKSQGNRRSRSMSFSPDDRYIVFDLETEEGSQTHDIHLLAVDGSRETTLVEHPADDGAPGWAPDGERVVFMSDRSGTRALWMLDVTDGNPEGAPALVKELGDKSGALGFSRGGSFHYWIRKTSTNVHVATLDFEARTTVSSPVKKSLRFEGANIAPSWSPDGESLAYASHRGGNKYTLVIQSAETGEERDILPDSIRLVGAGAGMVPRWSPDGRSILVGGMTAGPDDFALYLIDVQTEEISLVAEPEIASGARWPVFSGDGTHLYFVRDRAIIARDLETHRETELYESDNYVERLACSPDGTQLAFLESEKAVHPRSLRTLSVSGGPPRDLFALKDEGKRFPHGVGLSWMPDGRHVVVGRPRVPQEPDELWLVPATGGEPGKLNLGVRVRDLSIHPDGRRIAFAQGSNHSEIWALENFLPTDGGRSK